MAIIKLTLIEDNSEVKNIPLWINSKHLVYFFIGPKGTVLETAYKGGATVKETPEEILTLIKESENGK